MLIQRGDITVSTHLEENNSGYIIVKGKAAMVRMDISTAYWLMNVLKLILDPIPQHIQDEV